MTLKINSSIFACLIATCTPCVAQTHDEMMRSPSRFIGQELETLGKVVQAIQSGKHYILRVNITQEKYSWTDTIYVEYTVPDRPRYYPNELPPRQSKSIIMEDDTIELRGLFVGIKSYQAVFGQTIQLPHIKACMILPPPPPNFRYPPRPSCSAMESK